MIDSAASRTQIVVVAHDARFADALARTEGSRLVALEKQFGETGVADGERETPPWRWPDG